MRAVKALILVAALAWVGNMVVASVRAVRAGELVLHVRPWWLLLSAVIIVGTYLVLIRSWLYIVTGLSGKSIPFLLGARIWFVSNLGTLIPGRVWGIIQMGAMSADAGISPTAAGVASIINASVNIATGMAVGAIAGTSILGGSFGDHAALSWLLAGAAALGVIALPVIVPWAFARARRFGVKIPEEEVPHRLIAVSALANVLAWVLYGAAFLCLTRGIVDIQSRSLVQHIAANATSYVAGYIAFFTPAGIGVREETLHQIMVAANMATPAAAGAISVVSRLWHLIIQVLPGLIFLAYRRPRHEKDPAAG
ncbi:MAG TPA: lysylphosphatidylglycerol synthase domain-containing protein [Gemmatimonadaceae bacterium]|nr:lysylphosphatidylglycerol synthase domain-containing protein [Gemmatimonadaceae bacterium]